MNTDLNELWTEISGNFSRLVSSVVSGTMESVSTNTIKQGGSTSDCYVCGEWGTWNIKTGESKCGGKMYSRVGKNGETEWITDETLNYEQRTKI